MEFGTNNLVAFGFTRPSDINYNGKLYVEIDIPFLVIIPSGELYQPMKDIYQDNYFYVIVKICPNSLYLFNQAGKILQRSFQVSPNGM